LSYYLDESQHPIKKCYEYTKLWTRVELPELAGDIPSYTTFYRHSQKDIPEAVEVLGRKGEKAFRDRCAPYIRRTYDEMASNEWWVADNHTFDIISTGPDGQHHRLYLTAFFDARSGIFTGCHVTNAPCSQATLIALRKGILKYGLPENIYVDNGREFLTFDIGGLGHPPADAP
jgi:transposase InsO family protein